MPVKYHDYYKALGVSRDATQDQIQSAYRKLARTCHPDVSDNTDAESRFKEISEAYEVLKDPATRQRYDSLGASWKTGQEFSPPSEWERSGFNVRSDHEGFSVQFGGADGFSDFFETLFGDRFAGARPSAGARQQQRRAVTPRIGDAIETSITISLEDAFQGATKRITLRSAEASGERSTRSLDVRIPPGVTAGAVIRLANQGEPGVAGAPAGDLRLRVHIAPHPIFHLNGHHVEMTLPISPWEAALGAHVDVATLEGDVTLTIPPGSQSGHKLRLKGKGLPRRNTTRGDQHITLRIVVPAKLTAQERSLLEKLRDTSDFDPRNAEKPSREDS